MIGVGMSLEHPFDSHLFALNGGEHLLDRLCVHLTRGHIEIEHRVDHHTAPRRRIPH